MAAAIMPATPALPSTRKSSRWGRMFKNKNVQEPITHKRTASITTTNTTNSFRSSNSRASSMRSTNSRRSNKWFGSSNPVNDELPPVPAINPIFRQPYIPRNAAAAFLRTTTSSCAPTVQETLDHVTCRLSSTTLVSGTVEAPRRDSVATTLVPGMASATAPENYGLFSMSGVCEIVEEEPEHEARVFVRADSATGDDSKVGGVVVHETESWDAL